ncbi:MAG: site-2 protease family protein, partial [Lachnospiraceae bacterium]|nr:site-2 protease family protein [Lachnospiraceae bacterium]
MSILAFILIIGILIFIHELGHFLAAKKNGVGVVE